MARIRTIKPEFWSSPGIETLEYRWRLLYIGLWQLADDFGRGAFNPREFLGFVFPADMSEDSGGIRRGCGELRRVFGVEFYSVGGRHFYAIPSWEKHQKVDRRTKASKFPGPGEGVPFDPVSDEPLPAGLCGSAVVSAGSAVLSAESPGNTAGSAGVPGNSGVGTGEQGNSYMGVEVSSKLLAEQAHVKPPQDFSDGEPADADAPPPPPNPNTPKVTGDTPADWSTPDDPRCRQHAGLPRDQVPPCGACAQARRWFQDQKTHAKQARRAAIQACTWCDERGMVQTTDEVGNPLVTRCSHDGPPPVFPAPDPPGCSPPPPDVREKLEAWRHGNASNPPALVPPSD